MDLFVVPTISFRLLYGFLVLRHSRREILWFGVTAHPSAEWIARQLTEACGWSQPPRYIIPDRDGAYGGAFIRRLGAIGIRDRPTSARSPWQNGYAERAHPVLSCEIAWIMSLSSVSSIFVTCSAAIKDIIMKSVRTWR
jgi:hypothetical protein